MIDEFDDLLEVIKNNRPFNKTSLDSIKLTHYYIDEVEIDAPVSKTIEIIRGEIPKKIVSKKILKENKKIETVIELEEEKEEYNKVLEEIENIPLSSLNNNYYLEEEKKEFWTLEYNHLFRIVGTKSQRPIEVYKIEKILGFKSDINE